MVIGPSVIGPASATGFLSDPFDIDALLAASLVMQVIVSLAHTGQMTHTEHRCTCCQMVTRKERSYYSGVPP